MLYIFQVDSGTMITLDMNLALDTVGNLKQVISLTCKIPEEKQVLLISGGYSLDPATRVCNYSAGTDTSPIFLFNKVSIEDPAPPVGSRWDASEEIDMKEKVEGSLSMPPTYNTVVSRTQLAQRFYELAKEVKTNCERLVLDQHLMQQGWAAVIANLDDVTSVFKTRSEKFEKTFNQYLDTRPCNLSLLENFSQDLSLLSKIPVLPILLKASQDAADNSTTVNLLHWISSKDNQNSLEQIADISKKGIEKFDTHVLNGLIADVQKAMGDVDNAEMKEIRGLEERLCGLEQLMFQARKTVQEQGELAQAFLHNQNRVSSLKDPSIFPDLCASHKKQLLMLLHNHDKLIDIHRRCLIAKQELCYNLHTRLRWIMWVEGQLSDIDNKLTIYIENLKRIKSHLEVVQQIHLAPKVYLATVSEVVRRRDFSKVFLEWASQLSQQSLNLHEREIETRKTFNSQLTNHFLLSLFPGMDDNPPPFATEAPNVFDMSLPHVDGSDVELLRKALPEFVNYLHPLAPSSSLLNNFMGNTLCQDSQNPVSTSTQTMTSESGVDTLTQSENSKSLENQPSTSVKGEARKHSISESQREVFSPISEEVWLGEDFETVGVEKLDTIVAPSTSKVQKCKLESTVSEPVPPIENQEEHQLAIHRAHSEGDIGTSPIELPSEPTFAQDFMTADFYIDESMPSSYTESNGTSGLARSATGGHMTKSHHVVVAELQKQLDDKVMSISSMQEDLKAKNDQLEKHTSSLSSLNDTLREILLKDRQSLFQLKQQILEDKTRVSGEIGELVDSIAAVFFELKNELENEKSSKKNLEKTLQERILADLATLDNIFYEDDELQRYVRDNNVDLIAEDTKLIDFKKLFEIRRDLDKKNIKEIELWQQNKIDDCAAAAEKKYKDLHEEYLALSTYVKGLEEKLENSKVTWEEFSHRNQLNFELKKSDEIFQLQASLQDQYQKNLDESLTKAKKNMRLMPLRLGVEEVHNMWSKAGEDAICLINDAWIAEKYNLVDLCSSLKDTHPDTLLKSVIQGFINIEQRNQHVRQAQWKFWKQENNQLSQKCIAFLEEIKKQCVQSDSLRLESFDQALGIILQSLRSHPKPLPPCTNALEESLSEFQLIQKAHLESEKQIQDAVIRQLREQIQELQRRPEVNEHKSNLAILSEFDPFDSNRMAASVQTENKEPTSPEPDLGIGCSGFYTSSLSSTSKSLPSTSKSPKGSGSPTSKTPGLSSSCTKVSVLKCTVNDLVLLTYDETKDNYVVFILDSTPHFLNQECHADLGLTPEVGGRRRAWALGVVVEKEYCKAKKVPNRFRVPLDTRFFRVSVKPCPWLYSCPPSTSYSPT